MNFDFLKETQELRYIYDNCCNAEKLAVTMSVQSLFTSRKSAELLAKFIYLAAHNKQMGSLTFIEILNDPAVKEYINSRKVLNAFHHIRKDGNVAIHGDEEHTAQEAIDVLANLHFVAGETACMLGLIHQYPSFDNRVNAFPEIRFKEEELDEKKIEAKAREMFAEYIVQYDAQTERDQYYQSRVDHLLREYEGITSAIHLIPGDMDLNEVLEFKSRPANENTMKAIQAYFGFLGIRYIKKLRGELSGELAGRDMSYSAELSIYGENGYTTTDLAEFVDGILHDLPTADGFKIISSYSGPSVAPWFKENETERKEEFSEEITKLGETENFTYSVHQFLYNHGEDWNGRFENGQWIDLEKHFTTDILDRHYAREWWCWNLDMVVEFDYETHADVLEGLHASVRRHIPADQLEYCEDSWGEGDEGLLLSSIAWYPERLRTVQNFLDEINEILKPVMKECRGTFMGNWHMLAYPFAIASCRWTEKGFQISGTEL